MIVNYSDIHLIPTLDDWPTVFRGTRYDVRVEPEDKSFCNEALS